MFFCRILQKGTRVPVSRVRTEARALERTTDTGATVPCVAARRPIRLLPVDWVRLVCRPPSVSIVHKQTGQRQWRVQGCSTISHIVYR